MTEVARELGAGPELLRGWVKMARAARDTGAGPSAWDGAGRRSSPYRIRGGSVACRRIV
ncbi:hypothetical protein CP972_00010 [Streptomyces prasinus]|uniref:Transposase n=1 Tax=Streptomyces prasinus TaxID=67345 RepID=A0ABX6ANW5_9ACTN|nr:hypothetical protein CP972_00010 [Streptomyces prasinus]